MQSLAQVVQRPGTTPPNTHAPTRPPARRPPESKNEVKERARPAPNRPWWHPWTPTRLAHTHKQRNKKQKHIQYARSHARTQNGHTNYAGGRIHTHTCSEPGSAGQGPTAPGRPQEPPQRILFGGLAARLCWGGAAPLRIKPAPRAELRPRV